jgi:hypothetical protein
LYESIYVLKQVHVKYMFDHTAGAPKHGPGDFHPEQRKDGNMRKLD